MRYYILLFFAYSVIAPPLPLETSHSCPGTEQWLMHTVLNIVVSGAIRYSESKVSGSVSCYQDVTNVTLCLEKITSLAKTG